MSNENGYHGDRFLVDTYNSRQYSVRWTNGKPTAVHVFAEDPRHSHFNPNEVIFALDDEVKFTFANGGAIVSTTAYQISTNGAAKPNSVFQTSVEYQVVFSRDKNGETSLTYKLTKESIEALKEMDFDEKFPHSFSVQMEAGELGETIDENGMPRITSSAIKAQPFPPNHNGKAFIARENAEQSGPASTAEPSYNETKKEWKSPTMNRPSNDFNKATTSPRPANYKVSDATIEAIIRQYCKDLTELAADGRLDPVIGREKETNQALKVLTRRKQSSLCFTGDAGVGKSAMFAAIAQHLVDDKNLPESLVGARVLELDLQAMNAGAKFRGQFEEKLKPLIDGLQERAGILKGRKVIMAIDEIHSQLTAGRAEGGGDAGNMMKPFLTAQGISVMGTTTDEEYKKYIEKDGALGRRFEKMRLDAPNEENTVAIMKRLWPLAKSHNNLTEDLSDEDLRYIVTMSNRYAPQESQPSKAEKVLYMAAAGAEFDHRTAINKNDIISAVAQMSNLPVDFLNQSDNERFLKLETELPKEVLGQPGLSRIVDGLIGSRSGLTDENQPWGCFVLQGPTGTGKTETCKALARYLFGTEDALIKLDMSEYAEKHSVARLIGAPPGYVGFDTAEPALTEKIRKRPYSILLLDEIEKAHPDVYNILLPALNDGKMTDNQGKTVLFNNVIVIMTTNAGAAQATSLLEGKGSMGFGSLSAASSAKTEEELSRIYAKARSIANGGPFRPEMINRIEELGGFITFLPLDQAVVSNLAVRELAKINKRLTSQAGANMKDVTLTVSDEAMQQLAKEGYNPSMGARPLRKVVREKVANPFGKWLMANKEKVAAFVAEHGGVKIVIDSLSAFEPRLEKATAAVSNDNSQKPVLPVKKLGTKKPKP